MKNAINIVHQFIQAWNQHDVEAIAATLATDAVYIDSTLDEEINVAQILARAEQAFHEWPELHVQIIDQPGVVDNMIAVQFKVLDKQDGNILFSCAEFLKIKHEKICSIQAYFQQNLNDILPAASQKSELKSPNIYEKYRTSSLSDEDEHVYQVKLTEIMDQEKLYLDPEINLPQLANRLSMSTNHLSQVINNRFNVNFYQFINQYRVKKAKTLLADTNTARENILTIALQTGFSSKSTFNTVFKKFTGKTPSEFRNSHHQNSHDKT